MQLWKYWQFVSESVASSFTPSVHGCSRRFRGVLVPKTARRSTVQNSGESAIKTTAMPAKRLEMPLSGSDNSGHRLHPAPDGRQDGLQLQCGSLPRAATEGTAGRRSLLPPGERVFRVGNPSPIPAPHRRAGAAPTLGVVPAKNRCCASAAPCARLSARRGPLGRDGVPRRSSPRPTRQGRHGLRRGRDMFRRPAGQQGVQVARTSCSLE